MTNACPCYRFNGLAEYFPLSFVLCVRGHLLSSFIVIFYSFSTALRQSSSKRFFLSNLLCFFFVFCTRRKQRFKRFYFFVLLRILRYLMKLDIHNKWKQWWDNDFICYAVRKILYEFLLHISQLKLPVE